MSNEFVGGLDDNIVDIPDILEPKVGFNIRNPIELFFEESLPIRSSFTFVDKLKYFIY